MLLLFLSGPGLTGYAAYLILEAFTFPTASSTFSENEFNWDKVLTKQLKGENELIPLLSVFLFCFTEL